MKESTALQIEAMEKQSLKKHWQTALEAGTPGSIKRNMPACAGKYIKHRRKKMSRYYIAYGSNLSVEQMRHRTPKAKIVGTAVLRGWRLLFKSYATIEMKEGREVPVLVWEITDSDEASLDRFEGYPTFYYKRELPVRVTPLDGGAPRELTAMVYIIRCKKEVRQ